MNLTRYEQETVINFNAADKNAVIYSCHPATIRKLEKMLKDNPEEWVLKRRDEIGITVECPKNLVSLRLKTRVATKVSRSEDAEANNCKGSD